MTATQGEQHRENEDRPVIFGEVLFDSFPDNTSVLGGAPFNVAWHLQGFGLYPLFISRVGVDARGEAVQSAMADWGMDLSGLQVDAQHPTGLVEIKLDHGQPDFTILPDRSYDYIDEKSFKTSVGEEKIPLLYRGTLITRGEKSAQSLNVLRQKSVQQFVDINLRKECWNFDSVHNALQSTAWAKLNDEELETIARHNGIASEDIYTEANALKALFNIQNLIITQGSKGAFIIAGDELIKSEPVKVDKMVDTVGAGDAFSSIVMLGVIKNWPVDQLLRCAVQFAAEVCGIRGATTSKTSLYDKYIQLWGIDDG